MATTSRMPSGKGHLAAPPPTQCTPVYPDASASYALGGKIVSKQGVRTNAFRKRETLKQAKRGLQEIIWKCPKKGLPFAGLSGEKALPGSNPTQERNSIAVGGGKTAEMCISRFHFCDMEQQWVAGI